MITELAPVRGLAGGQARCLPYEEKGHAVGVTGPDNFDSDRACDFYALDVLRPLVQAMHRVLVNPESAEADDPDCDKIVAAVEVLAVLGQHIDYAGPPSTELVAACRDAFLERWDAYIDELKPVPGHKEARRAVIERTFERLLAVCRAHDAKYGLREFDYLLG